MAPLGSVLNFTITWHHLNWLQIWPLDGATCHLQEDNFAIWSLIHCFQILATTWRYLQWLQICSTGGATCISCKFGHQVAQLALVQHLVIRWRHLHCFQSWPLGRVTCIATLPWIALLALSVSIELVSSSGRVASVKFHKRLSQLETDRDPDP